MTKVKVDSPNEKYNELIMAVAKKYPNESRHETALRYIVEREEQANSEGCDQEQTNDS